MRVERILVLVCALQLAGCGSRTASAPDTRTPLADYVSCTSLVPVDPGIANEPKISIRGSGVINQPLGSPYTDQGAMASDAKDGDITRKISVTGLSALNVNVVGDYMI
jgi:hypothetical protein